MDKLTLTLTRTFNASASRVWQALTDPAEIREYMFGTNTETTWEKGSAITYSGEFQGKSYKDKGTIVDIIPERLLHTTHFSPLTGKPDVPENYAHVLYELEEQGEKTLFTLTQDNIENTEQLKHMEQNWQTILDGLEKLVEAR